MSTLLTAQRLRLDSQNPHFTTLELLLEAQTSHLQLQIQRNAGWPATCRIRTRLIITADGIEHYMEGSATGGTYIDKSGNSIAAYSATYTPPNGYFDPRPDATPKRLGEDKTTYTARIEIECLLGSLDTTLNLLTTSAPATAPSFHNSVGYNTGSDGAEISGDGVITVSHNSAGSDRAAMAGEGWSASSPPTSTSCTYNGVGMTAAYATIASGSYHRNRMFTIRNQGTGAQNVVGTLSGATDEHTLAVLSFTGVEQTGAYVGTAVTSTTNTSTPSVTVASVDADGMLASYIYAGNGLTAASAPSTGTERTEEVLSTSDYGATSTRPGSEASGVMSWTLNTTPGYGTCLGAIQFLPSGAAAGTFFRTGLDLAGMGGGGPFFGNPLQ